MPPKRVFLAAGARPNFMKVAPIFRALTQRTQFAVTLVHTGQHYDADLSDVFFRDLDLPAPDISLEVGSGTHGAQTGRVLARFESVILDHQPDVVIVVGDVNSTLACALAASKVVYPAGGRPKVAHVEAGLRSWDRTMPEEINRVLTDAIADILFTTEESAGANLEREGVPASRVFFVGNVMIDTLRRQQERASTLKTWERFGLKAGTYAVVTLHRPSNVDDPGSLQRFLDTLGDVARRLPVLFPAHPRTASRISAGGLRTPEGVTITPPLGYLDFLSVMSHARLVLTDSGGVQEETTVLGIPCLTLRPNTERPVTVTQGTNTLVGIDRTRILEATDVALQSNTNPARLPPLWDGRAADRIADILQTVV